MKKVFLLTCIYLFSVNAKAGLLPVEITNDFMKVSTMNLVMQMFPQTMYRVDIFAADRIEEPTYETVVGFVFLQQQDLSCTGVVTFVESPTCTQAQSCQVSGDAMHLPSCDVRSPQWIKTQLTRMKAAKKRFVLRTQCDMNRKNCQARWVTR